jgi:methoxymalonate biosynthesis acyl carrier protein
MTENQQKIQEFLSRFFRSREIGLEDDIFALGFVNSLLAMQLVAFVEKEFGMHVEDEDLDLDNFRSIRAISDLVDRKTAPQAAAAPSAGA